jgi:hypothetical protein
MIPTEWRVCVVIRAGHLRQKVFLENRDSDVVRHCAALSLWCTVYAIRTTEDVVRRRAGERRSFIHRGIWLPADGRLHRHNRTILCTEVAVDGRDGPIEHCGCHRHDPAETCARFGEIGDAPTWWPRPYQSGSLLSAESGDQALAYCAVRDSTRWFRRPR